MLTQATVLQMLQKSGAMITDSHIVLKSGKHSSEYLDVEQVYSNTFYASKIGHALAYYFVNNDVDIDVVSGPERGGIILSQWVAYHLSKLEHRNIISVYARKSSADHKVFEYAPHDLQRIAGKRVLVVDDIASTGGSLKTVIELTEKIANVVGAGIVCNRGNITAKDIGNVPHLFALANVLIPAWDVQSCERCKKCVPINTEVGHGKEFLANIGRV